MNVVFEPIPPDTVSSLRYDLRELLAKHPDVKGQIDSCLAFGSTIGGNFENDDVTEEFLKQAKRICSVRKIV